MPTIELEPDEFRPAAGERGAPMDFGKPSPNETTRETNPLIWGAVAGSIAAILVLLTAATGGEPSGNALLQNPVAAFAGAFFWGWAAGCIKVVIGKRMIDRTGRPKP